MFQGTAFKFFKAMAIEVDVEELTEHNDDAKEASRNVKKLIPETKLFEDIKNYRTHVVCVTDDDEFVGGAYVIVTETLFAYLFMGFNVEKNSKYVKKMIEEVKNNWLTNDDGSERVFGLFTNDLTSKEVSFMDFFYCDYTSAVDSRKLTQTKFAEIANLLNLTGNQLVWVDTMKNFRFYIPDDENYTRPVYKMPLAQQEKAKKTAQKVQSKEQSRIHIANCSLEIQYYKEVIRLLKERENDLPEKTPSKKKRTIQESNDDDDEEEEAVFVETSAPSKSKPKPSPKKSSKQISSDDDEY